MSTNVSQPDANAQLDRRALIAGIGGLAAGATLFAGRATAGPLSPPPGPIGSTGRTVQEIYDRIARTDVGLAEPRIPVQSLPGSATALHVISQPGSYYLTGNIIGEPGKNGIEVESDFVSLDLCGYSVSGGLGTLKGIMVQGGRVGLEVVNGVIAGWEQESIHAQSCIGMVLGNLRAYGDVLGLGPGGTAILVGPDALIHQVLVRRKGLGFFTDDGALLIGCAAIRCEGGYFLRRAQVTDCLSLRNNSTGFYVEQAGLIDRCEARENNGDGIQAHGHSGTLIRNCNCISNVVHGVNVAACTDVSVLECNLARNAGAGVHVNIGHEVRIEGNNMANNAVGIELLSGSFACVALRNKMAANGVAFNNAGVNSHGPIVNVAGVGDITAVPGADHPWANFIY